MKPTNYLRFVERLVYEPATSGGEALIGGASVARNVRILQQFWECDGGKSAVGDMFRVITGDWRDVPVERE
jgi:hypothetical protein